MYINFLLYFVKLIYSEKVTKLWEMSSTRDRLGKTFLAFMTMTWQGKHNTVRSSSQDCYSVLFRQRWDLWSNGNDWLAKIQFGQTSLQNLRNWWGRWAYLEWSWCLWGNVLISGFYEFGHDIFYDFLIYSWKLGSTKKWKKCQK